MNFEGDSEASLHAIFSRWTNVENPWDVTADGLVTARDALAIVNYINLGSEFFATETPPDPQPGAPYPDINGDYLVSPLDVLLIINWLNLAATGEGEGGLTEPSVAQAVVSREIVSLAITPEPAQQALPPAPLAALPAGVKLIDVPCPSGSSESSPVDHVWTQFAGRQSDARTPAPQLTLSADSEVAFEDREQWPLTPDALTGVGLGGDELASVLNEIADDVAQGWQFG